MANVHNKFKFSEMMVFFERVFAWKYVRGK